MKTEIQQPDCRRGTREALTEMLTNVDEKGDGVSPKPLTIRVKFVKLVPLFMIAPSSNGKTADSGQSSGFRVLRAFLPLPPAVDKIVHRMGVQ